MQLAILTIIAICSLIGVIILWEVRESIKAIPAKIVEMIFRPFHDEIKHLRSEINSLKDEIPNKGDIEQ